MSRVGMFLGKLFGGGGNEALLRAYGKLPMYAEYRRLEVSPGTPTSYSRWLDDGRLAWVRAMPEGGHGRMLSHQLLLQPPDSKEWIVACLWDSRDSLGRTFPFSFFVTCTPEQLGGSAVERLVSGLHIFGQLDAAHRELSRVGQGGDFYKFFQKRTIELKPDDLSERVERLRRDALAIASDQWYDAFGFPEELERGQWFAGLRTRAARWDNGRGAPELAVSCPIAGGVSRESQAFLWTYWIATALSASNASPGFVLPATSGNAPAARSELHLLFRAVLPNDFQLLTSDAASYSYVDHLEKLPQTAEGQAPATAIDGAMLDWLLRNTPKG